MKANQNIYDAGRRKFLKMSALSAVAGLLHFNSNASANQDQETPAKDIPVRTLGRTGLQVPVLSMGVFRGDIPGVVKAAVDSGVKLLDTAYVYSEGKSETMLGEVLASRPRDSFLVGTKTFGNRVQESAPYTSETKKEQFLERFEVSLKRLRLDYVDILYSHALQRADDVLFEESLNALMQAKKEGKARFAGVSTHENCAEVIRAAIKSGVIDVVLTSYNWQMHNLDDMNNALEEAGRAGIGIIGMKTFAGTFSDKSRTTPVNTQAAIRWALANPNVHTIIPSFVTFEQLQSNLKAVSKLKISDKEKKELLDFQPHTSLFCPGCSDCRTQCRKGLPIPDLMRAYMYAYGYREPALAQQTLTLNGVKANSCSDCDNCAVKCHRNFDVRGRVQDVVRVLDIPPEFLT